MKEINNLNTAKRNLLKYIFGGVEETVKKVCEIWKITNRNEILKSYKKSNRTEIKDLNYVNSDCVKQIVLGIAMEEFKEIKNIEDLFISTESLFGTEEEPSHYDTNNNESAKLVIYHSLLEMSEKEILLNLVEEFKFEIDFQQEIYEYFDENLDIEFSIQNFVSQIQNQYIDLECRFGVLSDILKKINLSIIKNNEIVNSRAYKYKKDIANKINDNILHIKKELEKQLEFYIKTIQNNEFLGLKEEFEPREFLIGRLIENKQNLDRYLSYEKKLISGKILSTERTKWLGTTINFIEFYQFCENSKIFNSIYNHNSKGVKLLRKLYRYEEGISLDKPSKRKLYNLSSKSTYHSFNSI